MPVLEVGTSPSKILEADPKRKFVSFQNSSSLTTTSIYLSLDWVDRQDKWKLLSMKNCSEN